MKLNLNKILQAAIIGALGLSATFSVSAQERKNENRRNVQAEQVYVISAKAGGVSYVTGAVRVDRDATKTRQVLAKGDELNDNDIISVGETGNAEILLNPGSFLRLAENTDIQFADTNLESLLLKMKNGSALIEATAVGGEGADITVVTPQSTVRLEKSGIYRLNVSANATEVLVWKGVANVGNSFVKAGRKAFVQKGIAASISKFEKDESRDALDIWSKDRAKTLAKLNDKLQRRELSRAFNGYSSGFSGFGRTGGFWLFNRLTGTYCYVPYGFDYYGSPYGYAYNRGIAIWSHQPIVVTPSQPIKVSTPEIFSVPLPGKNTTIFSPPSESSAPLPGKVDAPLPGKSGKDN